MRKQKKQMKISQQRRDRPSPSHFMWLLVHIQLFSSALLALQTVIIIAACWSWGRWWPGWVWCPRSSPAGRVCSPASPGRGRWCGSPGESQLPPPPQLGSSPDSQTGSFRIADLWFCWRQFSYAIKTQLKAPTFPALRWVLMPFVQEIPILGGFELWLYGTGKLASARSLNPGCRVDHSALNSTKANSGYLISNSAVSSQRGLKPFLGTTLETQAAVSTGWPWILILT